MNILSKLHILNFILALFLGEAAAQPIQVGSSNSGQLIHGKFLEIWKDETGQAGLEAIRQIKPSDFENYQVEVPNFGWSYTAYWIRFTLENLEEVSKEILIEYDSAVIDEVNFYYPNEMQEYSVKKSGDRTDASLKDFSYRLPVFRIHLAPGQTTFYIRVRSGGSVQVPIRIWNADKFQEKHLFESTFMAFFYGCLGAMILYNLFLALTLKKSIYGLYLLYLISASLYYLGSHGLYALFFPYPLSAWLNNEGFIMLAGLGTMSGCLFSINFLNMRNRMRPLYNVLSIGAILSALVIVIGPFNYNLAARTASILNLTMAILVLVGAIIGCFQRYRPAYFFTLAWSALLICFIIFHLALGGIIPLTVFSSWGGFIGISLEAIILSLALADKIRFSQELSERTIRDLNENLEDKVSEKTRDIKAILSSIRIGIFTISGSKLTIDSDYSSSLEDIVEESNLAGRSAIEILFRNSNLTSESLSQISSALEFCVGEELFSFQLNQHCFVSEMKRLNNDNSERILELDWNPMVGNNGLIEKILVTCKDVTDIRRYQEATVAHQKELKYIDELIAIEPTRTFRFFNTSKQALDENLRLIGGDLQFNAEICKVVFINIHTLKGAARTLGLGDLSMHAHDIEHSLSQMQRGEKAWNPEALKIAFLELGEILHMYVDINEKKLNRDQSSLDYLKINRSELKYNIEVLDSIEKTSDIRLIRGYARRLKALMFGHVYQNITIFAQELMEPLAKLAKDLGKSVPRVSFDLDPVLLNEQATEALQKAFIHILRNTMDHGIETHDERATAGKTPEGLIKLSVKARQKDLLITVEDDGRGLDLARIERIATEKRLVEPEHSLSPLQIAHLIFEQGLTTTHQVTDISGRGVGMDAIRKYLSGEGAQVFLTIGNNPHLATGSVPFSIHILLPPSMYRLEESSIAFDIAN